MRPAEPVCVECEPANGGVRCERSFEEIGEFVSEGKIVILKGALAPAAMLDYREAVMNWGRQTEPFPHGHSPGDSPALNYHRIDDGAIPSVCPHVFHQFAFNTIETLDRHVREPTSQVAKTLCDLQNAIADTRLDLSLIGLRAKVLHYPAGGGFMAEHTHPLEPQRIGLVLSMSQHGTDLTHGATNFVTPEGPVDTTREHNIGDVIVFRYDLPHEVTPVDEDAAIDWDSQAGKWSFVLELRETHRLSHAPPQG